MTRIQTFGRCYLWLAFSVLLTSCGQSERRKWEDWERSFTIARELKSVSCMDEELILGGPVQMLYADSSLFIHDAKTENLFWLIDLADQCKTYRFGKRGNAGNEFLQIGSVCKMNNDSVLGAWDSYRRELREINLGQVKRWEEGYPVIMKDTTSKFRMKLYATRCDNYLGLGFYEEGMLSLSGPTQQTSYFFEYPYRDQHERMTSNRLRGMAYQGTVCSNKSHDKFLYAIDSAPIFMLFSVSDNQINKTYEWIGGYPTYRTEETANSFSAPISADNKMSFISAYATERYIYLLYSGKSFREAQMKAFEADVIYRLSWDGEPVDKLFLDTSITLFCVSDDDKNLYALANKGELELVKCIIN